MKDITKTCSEKLSVFKAFMEVMVEDNYRNNFFPADVATRNMENMNKIVSASGIKKYWKEYLGSDKNKLKRSADVYITMPYCKSKCSYCIYFQELSSPRKLEDYKTNLINEMKYFADIIGKMRIKNIYFWGGTPSLFTEDQLEDICKAIKKHINQKSVITQAFEYHPSDVSLKKFQILKKYGFNSIDLGTQSFNSKELKICNRNYKSISVIKSAVENAKKAGFADINIEMIAGLAGQTPESFLKSFKQALVLSPSSILLYDLQPSVEYLKKYFKGELSLFQKHLKGIKNKSFSALKTLASEHGFDCPCEEKFYSSKTRAVALEFSNKRVKGKDIDFESSEKLSFFGFGQPALSGISNSIMYSAMPLNNKAAKNQFNLKKLSKRDNMLVWLMDQFTFNECLDMRKFKEEFSKDIEVVFKEEFEYLNSLDKILIKNNKIFLNETGARERWKLLMFFMNYKGLFSGLNKMIHKKWVFVKINNIKIKFALEYSSRPESFLYTIKMCKGYNYIFGLNSVFDIMKKKLSEVDRARFEPDYYMFKKRYIRELQKFFKLLTEKKNIKVELDYNDSVNRHEHI
ncbi:MAG: radical SAM protein [Elusimicrobiales bacterium]|nr:radical SAM protein [Elusimicrobiales bacterium]